MSLENITAKVKAVKVAGIPLGDAILILFGLGLNDALIPVATRLVKMPIISGGAIAVLSKLPVIERFLGSTMANVISATAVATGVDQQIALRARIHSLVSSLVGRAAPTAGVSALAGPSKSSAPVSLGQAEVSEPERRILEALKARR